MARDINKRREIRKLETKRDDLMIKIQNMRKDLAAVRASLKQAKKSK